MLPMKNLIRCALAIVVVACIALTAVIFHGPKEKEIWVALTGVLAVLAATIGVIPALRVLEIQEDVLRPRPTPYFDLTSRYDLVQLRVKNLGGGVAYDIRLRWNKRPINDKGDEITMLDHISVLLPQESVSTLVGVASKVVREMADTRFEGECWWIDAAGKKQHHPFLCSVDGSLRQLIFDEEMPRTLHELQKIPDELCRIADHLQGLTRSS
jgi:hypothetical protein